ncbi:MAG: hypothetical protein CMH61_02020 [Nanoarchaeota archaeon]|nr:hypothetical protein [Nanoarchaeota archaeon]
MIVSVKGIKAWIFVILFLISVIVIAFFILNVIIILLPIVLLLIILGFLIRLFSRGKKEHKDYIDVSFKEK